MTQHTAVEKEFLEYLHEIDAFRELITLAHWDLRTKIPVKGVETRSQAIGILSAKVHQMQTSDRMKQFIDELKSATDDVIIKAVDECEHIYNRNKQIPEAEFKEYVILQGNSEAAWQEAREKADFSLFQPYLEKLVAFNKKFANYWGYEDNIYDALLDQYEPGVTTKMLDEVFPALRKALTELLHKVNKSGTAIDSSVVLEHFPKQSQQEFAIKVLEQMNYDFDAGRLDDTIHPFEITINLNDVRITTRYDENDFRMAVFGIIHEGGHALYEQNIDPKVARTPLATGTSMGIHESQSLFWENLIGRSKAFWESNYDLFKSYAPNSFQSIDIDSFYNAINEVKPTFIRIEADELTYALHIMIRYELEKALINGDIAVQDLPKLWNEKMVDYLGIEPRDDAEGVLQDIHWAGGDFGYFPSYALGYMYAAQFYHTLAKDIDIEKQIQSKDLLPITEWLTANIHQYGKMKKPLELLKDITNEELNPDYLVNYLQEKYSRIYNF
ncbi:carboxypeptidase M32 [Oceanobacillus sp. FSL H7-0719]|uniref:carboxypeptidase M32 n=1 Tax=Oceanobacillus sp. FSL H7-0719 TaxID=2954507 RepID=UPI00324E0770